MAVQERVAAPAKRGLPPRLEARIEHLRSIARQVRAATDPGRRSALVRAMLEAGGELTKERDMLYERLWRGDRWLTDHPDHPTRQERDEQWLGWLNQYAAICDALADAKAAL